MWNGYKVHISETCHPTADAADAQAALTEDGTHDRPGTTPPNLVTNVATVPETAMTATIHRHLARRGLLPAEHYLDAGYSSAELIVQARERHQLALITPLRTDNSVQARTRNGYDRTAFTIDRERTQVTCPQGQRSTSRTPCRQKEQPMIVAAFPPSTCRPCPVRNLCTSAQRSGRAQWPPSHPASPRDRRPTGIRWAHAAWPRIRPVRHDRHPGHRAGIG
ncbi:hypothetical protein [Nonomuraea jabiensis]|uniref:hypothetical protein n=1 Tax=Nonomuraea jabiensis TaxID=882448 RepID=UPI003695A331